MAEPPARVDDIDELRRRVEAGVNAGKRGAPQLKPNPNRALATPLRPGWVSDEFPTGWLESRTLRDVIEEVARATCTHRSMAASVAFCAVATLAQGRSFVRVDHWREPLCVWWLCLSPTGSRKSAVLHLLDDTLRNIQAEAEAEGKLRAQRFRARLEVAKAKRRQLLGRGGSLGCNDRAELDALSSEIEGAEAPTWPMLVLSDINQANLPKILARNAKATGLGRASVFDAEDEFMSNFLGLHTKSITPGAMNRAYMGEPISQIRTNQGTGALDVHSVRHAYLSLCLLLQDHWGDRLASQVELSQSGWLGRCFVSSIPRPARIPPDHPGPDQAVLARWRGLLRTLHDSEPPEEVQLCERALEAYREADAMTSLLEADSGGAQRAPVKLARLMALDALCALAERGELASKASAVQDAEAELFGDELSTASNDRPPPPPLARGLQSHVGEQLKKELIYWCIDRGSADLAVVEQVSTPLTTLTHRTLSFLRRQSDRSTVPTVTLQKITNGLGKRTTREQVEAACEELERMGYIAVESQRLNRNRTITITYRIVTLWAEGESPEHLQPVDPEEDGR